MFYDAVLDDSLNPVYNGTSSNTRVWLIAHPEAHKYRVCIGRNLEVMSVKDYLALTKTVGKWLRCISRRTGRDASCRILGEDEIIKTIEVLGIPVNTGDVMLKFVDMKFLVMTAERFSRAYYIFEEDDEAAPAES